MKNCHPSALSILSHWDNLCAVYDLDCPSIIQHIWLTLRGTRSGSRQSTEHRMTSTQFKELHIHKFDSFVFSFHLSLGNGNDQNCVTQTITLKIEINVFRSQYMQSSGCIIMISYPWMTDNSCSFDIIFSRHF